MGLDIDVLSVPLEDAIDRFHFRGENLLGEVEPENLEEYGIIHFHYFAKDYPVFCWMLRFARKNGLREDEDINGGFLRLTLRDIKRMRMDISMDNIFRKDTESLRDVSRREYDTTQKPLDVEFCDKAEKYLMENQDRTFYAFLDW